MFQSGVCMSVRSFSPVTAVRPPVPTSFSDPLTNIAAFTGSLGPNWAQSIFSHSPFVTPNTWGTAAIENAPDSVNALAWSTGGGSNPNLILNAHVLPIPVALSLSGKTQFMQITYVNSTGVTNNSEFWLTCAARPDEDTAYIVRCNTFAGTAAIQKMKQSTFTHLLTVVSGVPAAGEILRFSVDYSVAGKATLRYSKNGSIFGQVDDVATLLTIGPPAIGAAMASGKHFMRNFSCGAGI